MSHDGFGHLKPSLEAVDVPPNNSLKLTRRAALSGLLELPASRA